MKKPDPSDLADKSGIALVSCVEIVRDLLDGRPRLLLQTVSLFVHTCHCVRWPASTSRDMYYGPKIGQHPS